MDKHSIKDIAGTRSTLKARRPLKTAQEEGMNHADIRLHSSP